MSENFDKLLINEIARLLGCTIKEIRERLRHPIDSAKVNAQLAGKSVQCIYKDWSGEKKVFTIARITKKGAHEKKAFGKLPRPYNQSVVQYFYSHHSIKLKWPFHQLAVEADIRGEPRFYPIELLRLISKNEEEEEANENVEEIQVSKEHLIDWEKDKDFPCCVGRPNNCKLSVFKYGETGNNLPLVYTDGKKEWLADSYPGQPNRKIKWMIGDEPITVDRIDTARAECSQPSISSPGDLQIVEDEEEGIGGEEEDFTYRW